jgi:flagellar basal-body rod protein FlgC
MSLGTAIQISASGLTAERLRLDVISNNIANVNTTRTASGQPYRRQIVTFQERQPSGFSAMLAAATGSQIGSPAGNGVEVSSIAPDMSTPFKSVYDPGNPDANAKGYVKMPNVSPIIEMVDMISASRSYESGVTAIDDAKQMQMRALSIGSA